MEGLPEASSAPICLIGGTQLLLYIWLLFLKQRWVTLALFGQGSSAPPPSLSLPPLQPPSSSAWEPALPGRSGFSCLSKRGKWRVPSRPLWEQRVGYLLRLAGGGGTAGRHGGRQQAAGVAFVVQVVDELSVFRFLCKKSHE